MALSLCVSLSEWEHDTMKGKQSIFYGCNETFVDISSPGDGYVQGLVHVHFLTLESRWPGDERIQSIFITCQNEKLCFFCHMLVPFSAFYWYNWNYVEHTLTKHFPVKFEQNGFYLSVCDQTSSLFTQTVSGCDESWQVRAVVCWSYICGVKWQKPKQKLEYLTAWLFLCVYFFSLSEIYPPNGKPTFGAWQALISDPGYVCYVCLHWLHFCTLSCDQ